MENINLFFKAIFMVVLFFYILLADNVRRKQSYLFRVRYDVSVSVLFCSAPVGHFTNRERDNRAPMFTSFRVEEYKAANRKPKNLPPLY